MHVSLHRASDNMWKITTGMFMLIGIIAFADRRVNASCPLGLIQLNPPSVVARYGDTVSVNCSTPSADHEGMGWEAEVGSTEMAEKVKFVTWTVDTSKVKDWKVSPDCYINPADGTQQCSEPLSVTLYKEPDSVSISHSSPTGHMVEGTAYQLRCDIVNVAPVRNLTVVWYKDNKTIHMQSYDSLTSVTPVNESSILTITRGRDDNGALVYCQTEINIGPSGPKPFASQSHVMTVHYPPTFRSSQTETVDQADDNITLDCTATGNPTPTYSWQCSNADQEKMGDRSVITTKLFPGTCNCTASNDVGNETKQFIINLPIIINLPKGSHPGAGTIAAIVVFVAVLAVSGLAVYYIRNRKGKCPGINNGTEGII